MNSLFGRIAPGTVARTALLVDLLLLGATLLAATFWSATPAAIFPSLLPLYAACVAVWLVTSLTLRHYDPWASDRQPFDDAAMVSILVLAVTSSVQLTAVLAAPGSIPEIAPFLLVLWPSAMLLRTALFRARTPTSGPIDSVLVVGVGPLGRATARELEGRRRREILGFLRFSDERAAPAWEVLGQVADLESVLRNMAVGEVHFASTSVAHHAEQQAAIKLCERFGVPFALPAHSFRLDRALPLGRHQICDGYVHYQTVAYSPTQMALKRGFDIVASGVALCLLSPLLVAVAVAIKLTSAGPVLFRQQRVGLHGRPFRMLKLRTMVVDAEAQKDALAARNEMDGPVFKIKNDPRVTPLGRFLRKYSIDELPQLVNVLRGDMAVVGPRPPVPREVARYQGWQRRRLSVRPGLTCIWQISGRNEISFEEWMYLDLRYIDTWTFAKDFELILKTIPVVLTGRGAS